MNIDATFVTSAAGASGLPRDDLAEVALVGRSNVGKSTLINALVRRRVARTSAAPGKTRLANVYRVVRGTAAPLYLVDLPGYGYARGGSAGFARIVDEYFGASAAAAPVSEPRRCALFVVDARHPGLRHDTEAWRWLVQTLEHRAVVATKIDKLSRAERQRAMAQFEAVLESPVLPVSAATGEGLDELWNLIERLVSSNPDSLRRRPARSRPDRRRGETARNSPRR